MEFQSIEDVFVNIRGHFCTSAYIIQGKLKDIKAYVFDWDGVFNDGRKGSDKTSDFSEIDSDGVNMLRFGHFLTHQVQPKTAVISAETNPNCIQWAERENFHAVYLETKRKDIALQHFCEDHNLEPENVAYFFDDILDVPVAAKVGLGMAVGRSCNPLFIEYLKKKKLADYISGRSGKEHAIREHCELLLMLLDKHFEVIDRRSTYDDFYSDYYTSRREIITKSLNYESIQPQMTS